MLMAFMFALWAPPALLADSGHYQAPGNYQEQMNEWRLQRHARLSSENGYLSQVGLEWLQEGQNRLGSLDSSTIKMPGGLDDWGVIVVDGHELKYRPAAGAGIVIDGAQAEEVLLVTDTQGQPTVVRHGNLSFYVIDRQSFALRIKDTQSPDLLAFSGVDSYEIQEDWRMNARFIEAAEGQAIEIANVLGQTSPSPVLGTVEFERDGETYRLIGLGDAASRSVWFLFADRTSGRETYGAGRFLYSDGMPENGRLVIDFNKAYNPPCAFNDYSTCPLPPQQNRLKLAVTAGEKKYHE